MVCVMSCHKVLSTTEYDSHISNGCLACIILGVVVSMFAFFYPVEWNYELDPNISAEENENNRANQVYAQALVYSLSVTGAVLVTIGGIISAFLLTKYILLEECVRTDDDIMRPVKSQRQQQQQSSLPSAKDASGASSDRTPQHSQDIPKNMELNKELSGGLQDHGPKSKLVDSDYLQYGSTS